ARGAVAAAADQSAVVPSDGPAVHAPARLAATLEAGAARQSVPRAGRAGGGNGSAVGGGGQGGQEGGREERRAELGGDPPGRWRRPGRAAAGPERGARVRRACAGGDQGPDRSPARTDAAA